MNAQAKVLRTTCPYCGTGCGVKALVSASGDIGISGDEEHPASLGRLCVKGAALAETLTNEGRLLYPQVDGARVSWNAALALVAEKFRAAIEEHGPDSVAFYVSGQMLTEDYYVANKLMKGFIGSANIDTNSRLCMASSVAGHKRAFGADVVPGVYEDLEEADLVVLVGSNLAWCHPVLFQRLERAKALRPNMRIVNVDPRRTATSELCDVHLALAPGSDVALFLGLLRFLECAGKCDAAYVARHTCGFEEALAAAQDWDLERVAAATGIGAVELKEFYALYAGRSRTVTVFSQGVNQSVCGTDKVNAIINCHLFTGRIGKPGAGPFSVTGQPNAMGGREVGGLANQLACHLELDDPQHRALVRDYWRAPKIADKAGLKAVELFDAVGAGKIKALWIIGTNPVDSLPQADRVRTAITACPFVVVSDVMAKTDTTEYAHVRLPARAWGEKDGTVTNSERRISRQRALRAAVGEAMPDWWIIARVAQLMDHSEAFAYGGPSDIFREYAGLSGVLNKGARAFDISAHEAITRADYDRLKPFQWPLRKDEFDDGEPKRFFANGGFFTSDRLGRFVATPYCAPAPKDPRAPFTLDTGRIRDQWHTMTRTGVAPRLSQHIAEPFVEMHPDDALHQGVTPAGLARVYNTHGSVLLRVLVTERQQKGVLFAPIHWTAQTASSARVDKLVDARVDPVSGQPDFKGARVNVASWPASWFGFALTRERPQDIAAEYWALARTSFGWRMELAGSRSPKNFEEYACQLFAIERDEGIEIIHVEDRRKGLYRLLALRNGCAVGLLLLSDEPVEAARDYLCENFESDDPQILRRLLAARPFGGRCSSRTICVCHNVGAHEIDAAITAGALSVTDVGRATRAGTGCGSCRPEIQRLVKENAPVTAPLRKPETTRTSPLCKMENP